MQTVRGVTRRDRGSIMVLTAAGMVFFVGLIAVATDLGYMYFQKARLETAVNAGWKAGFDEMTRLMKVSSGSGAGLSSDDKTKVSRRVLEVMAQNGYTSADLTGVTISFPNNDSLSVHGNHTFGLFFATVVNVDSSTVAAARGETTVDQGGEGVIPIGIPHGRMVQYNQQYYDITMFGPGEGFTPGSEYILRLGKVGPDTPPKYKPPSGADKWNHAGSLDFGSGGSDYENYFKYGFPSAININDRIYTEDGEIHGPTDDARDYRADITANPPRKRVTIPIVDGCGDAGPIEELNPGKKTVRVIGFATFDLIPEAEYSQISIDSGGLGTNDPVHDTGQVRGVFVGYVAHPDTTTAMLTTDGPRKP